MYSWIPFALFTFLLLYFFIAEHFLDKHYHDDYVRPDILTIPFAIAIVAAYAEYLIELHKQPSIKDHDSLIYIGLIIAIIGDSIRKTGIITLGKSFTLQISVWHDKEHHLITNGIYGLVRHPGYMGWYIWTLGTQIMLCNPICFIGFGIILFFFFKDRIEFEDDTLVLFFKDEYKEYKKKVPSGIPGIK
ncbi:MAG: putative protein-S-isoprenylcysteine O-methyltransferase [Streblomastix strix]|uniref:Protein-S-isoprenylcysteine O-methyltransferase n=1 Tax=Streblomastix strix TaxID=222440 RepID=A0A5J4UYZ7_9EUKA|nr:MAG: putative protein-S-isoprenylcysteine O-methyltransferase [Streblomastix strix]